MAQQLALAVEDATSPFQYALSTQSGCECIAHAVQAMTDVDGTATILSIDGVMLEALRNVDGGGDALPFVSQFYGSSSTYVWEDEEGVNHEVLQGEGGEQGDPLMPALVAVQAGLLPSERLLAFLDDIYVVCAPERVATFMLLSKSSCGGTPGSRCTKARLNSGTDRSDALGN